MRSRPIELVAYGKAHRLRQKMRDEELWLQGFYIKNAFETVMAHFGAGLAGKKSDAKYIEEPISQASDNKKQLTTEEEKQKAVDLFFAREKARRANWKRNKRKGGSVS